VPEQFSVGFKAVPPEDVKVIVPDHVTGPLEFSTLTTGAFAGEVPKEAPEIPTAGCWVKTKNSPGAPTLKAVLVAPCELINPSAGSVATIW
jgi:hypothetical protein